MSIGPSQGQQTDLPLGPLPTALENYVVLPAKTAAGKTLRALSYLPSETVVKSLSVVGYYGSSGVEWAGKSLEWLVNNLPLEEAADVASSLVDESIKAVAKGFVGKAAAKSAAKVAKAGGTLVPKELPTSLPGLQAVGERAYESGVLKATGVGAGAQAATKKGRQVTKSQVVPAVRWGLTKPLQLVSQLFGWLKEKAKGHVEEPGWMREQLIDKGDRLLGDVWRVNHRAQNYLDQMANFNKLKQKKLSALTSSQYEQMKVHEKVKLIRLVCSRAANFSSDDRKRLLDYQKALTSGEKTIENEEATLKFLLKEFNRLPHDVKCSLLDISKEAMGELSFEERKAMISLLMTKITKRLETLDPTQNKTKIRDLKEDLKRLESIQTLDVHNKRDVKKIATCFSRYLSAKEKTNLRKLFDQQLTATTLTKKQIAEASKKMNADLKIKLAVLEKAKGKGSDQEVLETAELIESLAMLSQIEAQVALQEKEPTATFAQAKPISKEKIDAQIGKEVREKGTIATVSEKVGVVAENIFSGVGKGMGMVLHKTGEIATPKRVEKAMGVASEVIGQLALIASTAKLLGAAVSYAGAEEVGSGLSAIADQVKSLSSSYGDMVKKLPGAAVGLQVADLLVSNMEEVTNRIATLEWQQNAAEFAAKALQVMKKSPLADVIQQGALPKTAVRTVKMMHDSFQSGVQNSLAWAKSVQPVLEKGIEVAKSKAAELPSLKDAKRVASKAAPHVPYVGSYIPLLLSLSCTAVDYATGTLVTKVLTKTATKSLKIMAPWVGKMTQPSFYKLAALAEYTGATLGSFARTAITAVGTTAEKALSAGQIDPLRIKNFQSLSDEEKAHLLYVVQQSGKGLIKGQGDERIRHILTLYDSLEMDERLILSPAAFDGLDAKEKARIVDVVEDAVGLKNRGDVEEIVSKFNALLKEERDAAKTVTCAEFRSMDADLQQDLLYRLVFSDAYRKEFLEDESDIEALRAQLKVMRSYQRALPAGDDLERLLQLGPKLRDLEKDALSPVQLQEWGQAKIVQAYTLLEEYGKLAPLTKKEVALLKRLHTGDDFPLRGKALILLAALYNGLERFQKNRLFDATKAEFDAFSKKEKEQVLQAAGSTNVGQAVKSFNALPLEKKAAVYEQFKNDRRALEMIREPAQKLIERHKNILQNKTHELEGIESELNKSTLDLLSRAKLNARFEAVVKVATQQKRIIEEQELLLKSIEKQARGEDAEQEKAQLSEIAKLESHALPPQTEMQEALFAEKLDEDQTLEKLVEMQYGPFLKDAAGEVLQGLKMTIPVRIAAIDAEIKKLSNEFQEELTLERKVLTTLLTKVTKMLVPAPLTIVELEEPAEAFDGPRTPSPTALSPLAKTSKRVVRLMPSTPTTPASVASPITSEPRTPTTPTVSTPPSARPHRRK